ncbi:bifunctional oligoribonuclease/PAP phosphatase NrnA [Salinicoccus siamensis]|uniref:Bifunctional oligoribonuclease/PAP phosphatase NrnA n=1 Tax=Salinicoccus siamensis TaxID=381830 RepID=A0ABV5Z3X4_9STAP
MFTEYINGYPTLKDNYKALINKINTYDEIIILRHVRPDPDAIGAQLGLKSIIQHMFPNKKVAALGDTEPSLSFLGEMDTAVAVDQPLVIVVDTANTDRIDGDVSMGAEVIKIDHHPNHDPYGAINIVETGVSSTSELIFLLASAWGFDNDYINDESARLLFAGIVGDTGRFLFNNTTELTHKVVAELKRFKFEAAKDMNEMNKQSLEQFKFKGHLIEAFKITDKGVLSIYIDEPTLEKYGLSSNEASMHVNIYREIDEAKIWFMAIEENDEIRVRLRAKDTVINDVAERFGGGGHPLASGITLKEKEEVQELIKALESKL